MSEAIHFIDSSCGLDACVEAVELAGDDHPLVCIGPPPGWNGESGMVPAAGWLKTVSVSSLRSRESGLIDALAAGEAVAHCWSIAAAESLLEALHRDCPPLVVRLSEPPGKGWLGRWRDLTERAKATAVAGHQADAEALSQAVPQADVRVIAPLPCQAPVRADRSELRARLGLAPDVCVLAAPGTVDRLSGHRLGVWAAAILTAAEVRTTLLLVDAGPAAREVARFAREAAFVDQAVLAERSLPLPELLAAADAALFAQQGSIPAVHLVSALAAGLPVVAADTHAARRWLAHGQTALLAVPNRPRSIAQAILSLVEDSALAKRLAAAGRSMAAGQFDPGAIRRQWADLYGSLLAGGEQA